MNKSKLRREILQQRQTMPGDVWQRKSQLICDRLSNLSLFKEAKTILAYFSVRQEVDLNSLFSLPKSWAFPRCVGQSLVWHLWQPGDNLNVGKYAITEPLQQAPTIAPSVADLILVPTVAFDSLGYRLGYGGGYYDRLLSLPECAQIPTIGIAFDFTYLTDLPSDNWDIRLNFICTEIQLISC